MKKELKTQISRKKIIKAAITEFGENGYKGASVNNICSTGIPKGLIYHNFKNRDEIYIACVTECYNDLLNILKKANLESNLKAYLSARLTFFEEQPMKANIIMETMLYRPKNLYSKIEEVKSAFDRFNYEYFNKILGNLNLRKSISEKDAMKYFALIQLMFNSYFQNIEKTKDDISSVAQKHEEALVKIIDLILYGIAERGDK